MTNHLAKENSPYLLQHAENPVDWYPWGDEALNRARVEDKPIFLSIGYAACHWCHVMAHESFEDTETAEIMNKHFINIKVDREERPDLDSLYMSATMAMTRIGGWPMSVFLTPDLEPFFAGTYFPPVPRYQMPSFKDVLFSVASAWMNNREDILHTGNQVKDYLQRVNQGEGTNQFSFEPQALTSITNLLLTNYDHKQGGWGSAPKFPQPMLIDFLIMRMISVNKNEKDPTNQELSSVIEHVLTSMAKGGMYDLIGGGFARYSVDSEWLVPHFEKMLYDNAQLALTYLHGYLVTGNEQFRQVCEETLTFMHRELLDPSGGFYSSLDADSEGEEGKYYVWEYKELKKILGTDFSLFETAYDISPEGNWEGKIIFRREKDLQTLAENFKVTPNEINIRLEKGLRLLFKHRANRIRPATDDKILVSWNSLALMAFAEAGRYLKRKDFIEIAQKNANFLLNEMVQNGRLLRSWRSGIALHNAYLDDYASLMLGFLSLYQTDHDPIWYQWALRIGDEMEAHFRDPEGGFFDTSDDHEQLLVRPKDIQDNATPSGNALAATALLKVAAYGDRPEWKSIAETALAIVQNKIREYPTAFGKWLQAVEFSLGNVVEIAILGNLKDQETNLMIDEVWEKFDPFRVVAISPFPPLSESPKLVKDRPLVNGKTTAYVCQDFVCKTPVNDLAQLAKQLNPAV